MKKYKNYKKYKKYKKYNKGRTYSYLDCHLNYSQKQITF